MHMTNGRNFVLSEQQKDHIDRIFEAACRYVHRCFKCISSYRRRKLSTSNAPFRTPYHILEIKCRPTDQLDREAYSILRRREGAYRS